MAISKVKIDRLEKVLGLHNYKEHLVTCVAYENDMELPIQYLGARYRDTAALGEFLGIDSEDKVIYVCLESWVDSTPTIGSHVIVKNQH